MKIMIIQKSFSYYRKGIFDILNDSYNFILVHGITNNGIKQNKEDYSKVIKSRRYGRKPTNVFFNILPHLIRFKPNVVIHEFTPSILSLYFLYLYRLLFKYKIILWGHGFNRSKKFTTNSLVFRIRKMLIQNADAVLFYGTTNKIIMEQLIPSNKYFIAHNSLNTTMHKTIYDKLNIIGKNAIKKEIEINNKYNIIFIGRLLEEKVLSPLFAQIIKNVQDSISDVGVIIIGEGPARNRLNESFLRLKIENVQFLGSIHDEHLIGKYLYGSDLLLMPGYVGLAANHALSYLIPVVTFKEGENGPYHSPEIEYVVNEKTGFLAKPFDVEVLSVFVITYLRNIDMQVRMKKEIIRCLEYKCNIEKMKQGFEDAINFCLNDK